MKRNNSYYKRLIAVLTVLGTILAMLLFAGAPSPRAAAAPPGLTAPSEPTWTLHTGTITTNTELQAAPPPAGNGGVLIPGEDGIFIINVGITLRIKKVKSFENFC